jgi:ubiquinone/menaquinone biosynthesis C-methylase UbiE
MNIQSAYNIWANNYDEDKNLTRDLDAEIVRKVFSNQKFDSILEVGCGTGKNTIFFTSISNHLTAIDFSDSMISKAKKKVKSENVSFKIADITKDWGLEENKFDLITFNLILEHIENLNFIFKQTHKHLISKGLVFINELHPFRQYDGKKAEYEENGKIKEIDAFVHNISDFIDAANKNGLKLLTLNEFWHEQDQNKLPRVLSLKFIKD